MSPECPHCGREHPEPAEACPRAPRGAASTPTVHRTPSDPTMLRTSPPGTSDPPPSVPATVGGFRIEGLLGRGGMGAVYRAVQTSLGRHVALKVLPDVLARDAQFVERFEREALALADLSHPNIVTILDRGRERDIYYFVMELVRGRSLRERMQAGPVGVGEAIGVGRQAASALAYAHRHGVVHRDIKPENILLDESGNVKVGDFGLARIILGDGTRPSGLTAPNTVLGTPYYMSPEQTEGQAAGPASDLYSLGVVLYECITGKLPMGRFEAPGARGIAVPEGLDGLLMALLAENPARRPPSADAVEQELTQLSGRPALAAAIPVAVATTRIGAAPSAVATPPAAPARGASLRVDATCPVAKPGGVSGWAILSLITGLLSLPATCLFSAAAFWALGARDSVPLAPYAYETGYDYGSAPVPVSMPAVTVNVEAATSSGRIRIVVRPLYRGVPAAGNLQRIQEDMSNAIEQALSSVNGSEEMLDVMLEDLLSEIAEKMSAEEPALHDLQIESIERLHLAEDDHGGR